MGSEVRHTRLTANLKGKWAAALVSSTKVVYISLLLIYFVLQAAGIEGVNYLVPPNMLDFDGDGRNAPTVTKGRPRGRGAAPTAESSTNDTLVQVLGVLGTVVQSLAGCDGDCGTALSRRAQVNATPRLPSRANPMTPPSPLSRRSRFDPPPSPPPYFHPRPRTPLSPMPLPGTEIDRFVNEFACGFELPRPTEEIIEILKFHELTPDILHAVPTTRLETLLKLSIGLATRLQVFGKKWTARLEKKRDAPSPLV